MKQLGFFSFLVCFFLFGCGYYGSSTTTEIVYLNGEVTMEVEVFSEFVDPGVTIPENFTMYTEGNINTDRLGQNIIRYTILDGEGVTSKEFTRIVNVVDTTPPGIEFSEETTLHLGREEITDFFSVSDNYYPQSELVISCNFDEVVQENLSGVFDITITVSDPTGNSNQSSFSIEIFPDLFAIIGNFEKNDSGIAGISLVENPSGNDYYHLSLLNGDDFYVYEDNSIQYMIPVSSTYSIANVSVSGVYGELTSATLVVSIIESYPTFSVGYVRPVNITEDMTSCDFVLSPYRNNANIPQTYATDILNHNAIELITRTKHFFEDILNLPFK